MNRIHAVDANVIIHFFLEDNPRLSPLAKQLFQQAESGETTIYIDEMVVAETIWVMRSYYKVEKEIIISRLEKLLLHSWVVNPRKKLIQKSLSLYAIYNLDYVDCWIMAVVKSKNFILTTFDRSLDKLARTP